MQAGPPESPVAIIELRCRGLEHAPYNASLVVSALAAWPCSRVDVFGDPGHLGAIREILTGSRPGALGRIDWHELTLPNRSTAGNARWHASRRLLDEVDRHFRRARPAALILATADPQAVALLKARLYLSWRDIPSAAVMHELLATLTRRHRSWKRIGLKAAFRIPHPRQLRYVVLGQNILDRLNTVSPRVAARTIAIDHPSLLGDFRAGALGTILTPPPLRFGFVGGGRDAKGFDEFLQLARAVQREHPSVTFEVVGSAPPTAPAAESVNLVWSHQKLPLVEFVARLRSLSHVIWLGHPRHYDLVASGSLADAIALELPVVCQAGPFVDHLFRRFGDIGSRCETLEDMARHVSGLAASFDAARYRQQKEALARAKQLLSPESAASLLAGALGASRS